MYRIVVHGTPAPQGSKKFVGTFKGGDGREHARLVESSKKVKPWREDVRNAALEARGDRAPLDGPIRARMVFTMVKPMSAPKRRRTYPVTYPDVSKLARSTEDALVEAQILVDDARIVQYDRLAKVYPGEDPEALNAPGVLILLELLEETAIAQPPAPARSGDLFAKGAAA